jgi:hypothetical protein
MMKYGAETPIEHKFTLSYVDMDKRPSWIDVQLALKPLTADGLPPDLQDPTILVICNYAGELIQIVLQNEGCDCDYQLTYTEKEQIEHYFSEHIKARLDVGQPDIGST